LLTLLAWEITREGAIYILTNKSHSTLYVGATSNLKRRISEHIKKRSSDSFTARYNLSKLVYFEKFENIEDAFLREKQSKPVQEVKKKN
jgi:putative endonuclease